MSEEEDTFENDEMIAPDDDVVIEPESDVNDCSSLTAKEAERLRLQAEVEAFLASGGKINQIPPNVVADPPRKPESNYGGQPI